MAWRSRSVGRFAIFVIVVATARAASAAADQVVFQRGVSPTTSYTATSEPSVRVYTYTTSSSPSNEVTLHLNTPVGARWLTYFDISSIPAGSTITQATLRYYCYNTTPIRGSIFLYRVRTNWLGGAAWTTAGGDWADASGTNQGSVPYATFQALGTTGWFSWDVTALAQGWVRGDFPNYGMIMIASASAQSYAQARGSGYTINTTLRPRLEVTYTASSGDTTAPTGTITINSAAATTQTTAVTLTLSATDNSGMVSQMQFSNDGTTYSPAEAYATTKSWTLTSGDGTKTVYAKFKDAAGNWSTAVSDTIVLDSTAPTISTQSASGMTAAGATITWTTNEAATSQVDYGSTTSYGQTTTLNATLVTSHSVALSGLSAGTTYHYRARSKDAAGNERLGADATFTTTAASDTTPPTGSITINSGATATNSTTATLTLSATDNAGAVSQMQFSNDGATYSAAEAFATSKTWTLATGDGAKTVYAKFKDAAGNWSVAVSDTIVLDTVAPTLSFTSPTDGQVIVEPLP